ncbi:signal-regulatory protein beta-2-like [Hippoglossus stenolepis]|uniref:signal-regulatory protein beta-2-like n=1 Tax=Hippoglossus stenolepis TaxID=195615 RepID=UPI001FAF7355|nr:signal-regulatory protein beta-2-like [Hippoglossus stenolepis]
MLILFQLLLLLRVTRSERDQIFETKTVDVGDEVKLTCSRQTTNFGAKLFWIRLVSGNLPEFLGGTYSHDYPGVKKTPHFTVKQEPGSFVLYINKTETSDAGVYYCIEQETLDMKLLNETFLKIKGPEPDITAVIQVPPSDTVSSGDSVTLQCSVLSDSDNHTCPRYDKLYWFRADESHPSLVYVHGSSGDECNGSLEAHSPHRCVFNFCKSFSSSDFGTYYCAVVTSGEILFGQGIKLENEALNIWTVQKDNTVLCLLSAALAISLIVIVVLIKKKMCDCCKAGVSLQTEAAAVGGNPPSQQRHEDSLVYSAPTFTRRKAGKTTRRGNVKPADGETVYSGVRAYAIN